MAAKVSIAEGNGFAGSIQAGYVRANTNSTIRREPEPVPEIEDRAGLLTENVKIQVLAGYHWSFVGVETGGAIWSNENRSLFLPSLSFWIGEPLSHGGLVYFSLELGDGPSFSSTSFFTLASVSVGYKSELVRASGGAFATTEGGGFFGEAKFQVFDEIWLGGRASSADSEIYLSSQGNSGYNLMLLISKTW